MECFVVFDDLICTHVHIYWMAGYAYVHVSISVGSLDTVTELHVTISIALLGIIMYRCSSLF